MCQRSAELIAEPHARGVQRKPVQRTPAHVAAGTRYPAVLVETADHDTRVHWAHSTKLTARLQEAQAGERPIYFYMEREQGHGAGTRLGDLVAQYSRYYAFIERELGVR